jgi:mRNA interferase MazF
VIHQGEVYWTDLGIPMGSEPGYTRPTVVIQNDAINSSLIRTVIVVPLSSNTRLARAPGNVLLNEAEANLPKRSVAVVSQVITVDKEQLLELLGNLSSRRIRQILNGLQLLTEPREA